jgi:hypothetical protein
MSAHSKRVLAAGPCPAVITLAGLGLGAVIRHAGQQMTALHGVRDL